jgi:protease II
MKDNFDYFALYRYKDTKANAEVVFDPVKFNLPGFYDEMSSTPDQICISNCQSKIACVYNLENSEMKTIFVKNISKAKLLQRVDTIRNSVSPCFNSDSSEILYIKQDKHGRPFKVMKHKIGKDVSADQMIFEELDPKCFLHLFNTKCEQFTILHSNTKSGNEIYLTEQNQTELASQEQIDNATNFFKICSKDDRILSVQTNSKGMFLINEFNTKSGDICFRILFVSFDKLERGLTKARLNPVYTDNKLFFHLFDFREIATLHPEFNISEMDVFDHSLIIYSVRAGDNKILKINLSDQLNKTNDNFEEISFEEIKFRNNQIGILQPAVNSSLIPNNIQFYFDNSFVYNENYEYNFSTNQTEKVKDFSYIGKKFDSNKFLIKQVNYPTSDGKLVPLTLIYSKKLNLKLKNYSENFQVDDILIRDSESCSLFYKTKLNWNNTEVDINNVETSPQFNLSNICSTPQKVLLKCYGTYGVSAELGFNFVDWTYLENDYVLAYPHIRGGGDLGTQWHHCTLKENKHLSVYDLVDCFHFLIGKEPSYTYN